MTAKHVLKIHLTFCFVVLLAYTAIGPSGPACAGGVGCGVGGSSGAPKVPPGVPCTTPPPPGSPPPGTTGPVSTSNPTRTDSPACDANFMNQIYAKAFLEAERETVINNSIFLKPDSVLEYTCYDQLAAKVATDAGPIFSESTRWSTASIYVGDMGVPTATPIPNVTIDVNMGNTHLDKAIELLALESLKTYVDSNFSYTFLGGSSSTNNNISATVAGVSSVCDFMFSTFFVSKCDDFALNAPFMDFDNAFGALNLLATDPRTLPVKCPSGHQITANVIKVARNKAWNYAAFDPVDPFLTRMGGPKGGSCEDPIPTGVMVAYVEYGQDPMGNPIVVTAPYSYEDKVCPNPGCYFDNKNNASSGDDTCTPIP